MTIDPGSIWRFSLQPSSTVANRPTRRLIGSERIVANPDYTRFGVNFRLEFDGMSAAFLWLPVDLNRVWKVKLSGGFKEDGPRTFVALSSLSGHWLRIGASGGSLRTNSPHDEQEDKNNCAKPTNDSRPRDCGDGPIGLLKSSFRHTDV
jgi:hypothetical protein